MISDTRAKPFGPKTENCPKIRDISYQLTEREREREIERDRKRERERERGHGRPKRIALRPFGGRPWQPIDTVEGPAAG